MSFACGVLRWTPKDFWSATLGELEGAASAFAPGENAAMPRGGLIGLMARFPDDETERNLNGI